MPDLTINGIWGGIDAGLLEAELIKTNAAAVFVTSPTYEGIVSDIEEIAQITHRHNSILIVDEAHGSHFKYSSHFPKTALSQGADIVVQSHHKTLAALSQGGVLHIQGDNIDAERLQFNLSVMQTTSPSYIIMASLDKNRELLECSGEELFEDYVDNLLKLRSQLTGFSPFTLLERPKDELDIGKITLITENNGKELDSFLRGEHNIYCEMSQRDYALFMTSFADSSADYERLIAALHRFNPKKANPSLLRDFHFIMPEIVCSPKDAFTFKSRLVPLERAAGEISGEIIMPYPPGIPLIAPGERFTDEVIDFIRTCPEISQGIYVKIVD